MARRRSETWGSEAEVCRRTALGRKAVRKLVERGLIGVFAIEGTPDRFNLADVDELIASGIKPAWRSDSVRELVEA